MVQKKGKGGHKGGGGGGGGNAGGAAGNRPSPSPSTSSQATSPPKKEPANPNSPFSRIADRAGVVVSVHPIFPDFGLVQGELFFECTLFLYSVLALFLQYLNLYKSLWWLPKSYWHYSLKMHYINPYFLSCVGLLLGLRVTKCFWSTITLHMRGLTAEWTPLNKQRSMIIEYGILKLPVTGMIFTSFCFSFTRIVREFPPSSVTFFFFPLILYIWLFYREHCFRFSSTKIAFSAWREGNLPFSMIGDIFCREDLGLLDLERIAHLCSDSGERIRGEVDLLLQDFVLRTKRCLFAGLTTAFLSIGLPLVFVPYKTSLDMPFKILISETWEAEMSVIVFLTAFSHYVTYLFPITYLDLLYRSAVHVGRWQEVRIDESPPPVSSSLSPASFKRIPPAQATPMQFPAWSAQDPPYPDGTIVETPDGKRWKAIAISDKVGTVAAMPGHAGHAWFAYLNAHHLSLINVVFYLEFFLIFIQSWLLVLTHEWQHIVTLVLLMFTNYLLLAKIFKDRVILNRMYEPSKEDLALIEQVQAEARKRETPRHKN